MSAILHKEWSLGDLANNGQVSMQYGGNIKNANFYGQISKDVPVNDATLYVAILDSTVAEQVQKHTLLKIAGAEYYPGQVPVVTVPVMVPNGNVGIVHPDDQGGGYWRGIQSGRY